VVHREEENEGEKRWRCEGRKEGRLGFLEAER
jgi:hypothetical protein